MNGPDANAGFTPNLSINKGVMVPKNEESITTLNNAKDTTQASLISSPMSTLTKNTMEEMANPLIKATTKPL